MATNTLYIAMLLIGITVVTEITGAGFSTITPQLMEPTCPRNTASNKEKPSKENNLHQCKLYSCNSCCAEAVTYELAGNPLERVGAVNFSQCGKLSEACSEETSYMECFYQCSPNLFPWMNPGTRILRRLPICASFCDAWFMKCQMDQTCVPGNGNWLTGLERSKDANGKTLLKCQAGVQCRNYSTVYTNGTNMCNNMWGNLFVYTPDDQPCLHPYNPKDDAAMIKEKYNAAYVEDCYPESVSYTDPGMIVGIVLGVLAGLCLIVAGVAFYLNRKKGKKFSTDSEKPKRVEVAPPEEMATLKSSQPAPATHADSSSDSSDHE